MRSFVKIESSQNHAITLSITDRGKSCPSREFLTSQIHLLTLLVKIKFLTKISVFTVIHAGDLVLPFCRSWAYTCLARKVYCIYLKYSDNTLIYSPELSSTMNKFGLTMSAIELGQTFFNS